MSVQVLPPSDVEYNLAIPPWYKSNAQPFMVLAKLSATTADWDILILALAVAFPSCVPLVSVRLRPEIVAAIKVAPVVVAATPPASQFMPVSTLCCFHVLPLSLVANSAIAPPVHAAVM